MDRRKTTGISKDGLLSGAGPVAVAVCATVAFNVLTTAAPPIDIPAAEADAILGGGAGGIEFVNVVSCAGDVDGDGVEDLAIGSAHDDDLQGVDDLGRSLIVSGATLRVLLGFTGAQEGDRFGIGVACAGDADGDGYADVLVGTLVSNGAVRLYSSRTSELIRTYTDGSQPRVRDCPGDVNGDGILDHMVWAANPDHDVRVYDGATGVVIHLFNGFADFGRGAGPAGDVDGDGRADVVVGADGQLSDNGVVYVYSGATGNELYSIGGVEFDAHLGRTVGTVGDVDRDGLDDFAAAARHSDIGGPAAGAVYIWSGADGAPIREHIGDETGLQLCSAIAPMGDVSGDGVDDYVIATDKGIFGSDDRRGRAFIHSGRTGALLASMTGEMESDYFGGSVAALDLDVDGRRDLVVAARNAGTYEVGLAYVFMTPPAGYDEPSDLDGDGDVDFDDLLVTLGAWGPCAPPPDPCPSDTDGDGETGFSDLLRLLACWSLVE